MAHHVKHCFVFLYSRHPDEPPAMELGVPEGHTVLAAKGIKRQSVMNLKQIQNSSAKYMLLWRLLRPHWGLIRANDTRVKLASQVIFQNNVLSRKS